MWPWVCNSPLEPGGLPSGHTTEDYDCPFPHNPIGANSLAGMSRPPSIQPMINWNFVLVHCRHAWLLRGLDYIGSARPMRQHFTPLYSTLQLLYFFHALLFPGHLRALEWVVMKSPVEGWALFSHSLSEPGLGLFFVHSPLFFSKTGFSDQGSEQNLSTGINKCSKHSPRIWGILSTW